MAEEAVANRSIGVTNNDHNIVLRTLSYNGVIKEGYLVKKGHIRHNWRTRWFILTRTALTYFKNREDSHPKGQITLVGASLDCPNNYTKRPWMLKITTVEGKEYLIEAPDHMSRTQWQIALEERIRKLDPSKLPMEINRLSTLEKSRLTLRRSFQSAQNETEISMQRDIVQAMQDSSAGVPLQEIKRGRHVDKCFNGKNAIDWIISWFFASDRKEAIELANRMLRNGFFHAIENSEGKFSTSMIAADKGKFYEFQDMESANYIFVSFAPVQSTVDLFSNCDDIYEEEEWDRGSDSSSPELPKRIKRPISMDSVDTLPDTNDDQIIRQGFLLKKGHVRKTWKIRKFVLKQKSTHLCYYKSDKIQSQPQGAIPLLGCVITKLDSVPSSSSGSSSTDSSPSPSFKTKSLPSQFKRGVSSKPFLFCLQTSHGIKYYIQAGSEEERTGWIHDLELHIKMLIVSPNVNVTT